MKLFAFLLLATGGMAAASFVRPERHPLLAEPEWSVETLRKGREQRQFNEKMMDWKAALEKGRPLRVVVEEARSYCTVFFPAYLDTVCGYEGTNDMDEAIALNLIGHFRAVATPDAASAYLDAMRRRLERELATWPGRELRYL